ncbi:hypothetical protein [Streptomyces exfoliatus]|uniref:hypothetical protein n=1 Tax=Streptomyces exfoliatus TaxID=1905 RepID=UPI003F4D703B
MRHFPGDRGQRTRARRAGVRDHRRPAARAAGPAQGQRRALPGRRARIPGVTVVDDAVDAAGRHGVAVARTHAGERTEWIFDKNTLEFLGERGVMVEDTAWAKAGQITATTAVLNRGISDEPGESSRRAN